MKTDEKRRHDIGKCEIIATQAPLKEPRSETILNGVCELLLNARLSNGLQPNNLLMGQVCTKTSCGVFGMQLWNCEEFCPVLFLERKGGFFLSALPNKPYLLHPVQTVPS